MKLAYLTNVYPKLSHTFIRREIVALEECGIEVLRMTVRRSDDRLEHPADTAERSKTIALLERGMGGLVASLLRCALSNPIATAVTAWLATRIGIRSANGLLRHWIYLLEACALQRILMQQGVNHVHAHFGTNAATVALLAHRLGGLTYSLTIHGAEEFDKPEFLHLGLKVSGATFVAAISDFARSQIYRWSDPDDWPRIHVVRCSVDRSFIESELVPVSSEPRLVSVGRFSTAKGHFLLIEAARALADKGRDFRIVLVGDGPLRQRAEKLVKELDLSKHVVFTGALDESRVREEILASRCMLLPSFIEGLPVTLMESFALARPAIASRVAGIPELLEDGVSGWLITPGRVDELASAIEQVLDAAPERLYSMGQAGRAIVAERHDSSTEARKLARLFTNQLTERQD